MILVFVAVGTAMIALLFPYFGARPSGARRLAVLSEKSRSQPKVSLAQRLMAEDASTSRRKQLQEISQADRR